jgi:transcription elongation factor Elf1
MKHHAVQVAPKALPTKQPTPDNCQDCGHGLHIAAVKFGLRRARAIFSCAACGWDYAER